ncbi:hypothetical protein PF006_g32348 [Phytophthora fragariae]|uniref:Uncharacterized protein n=1 Tax=Phytophthora fragariae TaxID=53985 RepID=A0A6A3PN56_9STRA|nr:hypothetical protein PF006_g32348 [Phytophthora fragariae]
MWGRKEDGSVRRWAGGGGQASEEDSVRVDAAEDGGLQAAEEDGRGQRTVACGGSRQRAAAEDAGGLRVSGGCVQRGTARGGRGRRRDAWGVGGGGR